MLDAQASLIARSPDNLLSGFNLDLGMPVAGTGPSSATLQGKPKTRRLRSSEAPAFALDPQPCSTQAVPEKQAGALSFFEAVDAMRAGRAVRRACGRRLYMFIEQQGERFRDALGCTIFIGPDDVLATDWEIAGEAIGRR